MPCKGALEYRNPNVTTDGSIISTKRLHFPENSKVSNVGIAWKNETANEIVVAYSMIDASNNGQMRFYEGRLQGKSQTAKPSSSVFTEPPNISFPRRRSFPHRLYSLKPRSTNALRYVNGEDARVLYISDDEIHIIWNDLSNKKRLMHIGRISLRHFGKNLHLVNITVLEDQRYANGVQKNWSPFKCGETLYLEKSINPHCVFKTVTYNESYPSHMHKQVGGIEFINCTHSVFIEKHWKYGSMRGGSPSYRLNESHYIGTFHSSVLEVDHKKKGFRRCCKTYYMGFYMFESAEPFKLSHISDAPLVVSPPMYRGPPGKYTRYVVFPTGMRVSVNTIDVVFGVNDREVWMITLRKQKLLETLRSVNGTVTAFHPHHPDH